VKIEESFQNEAKLFIILEYCSVGNLSRILSMQIDKRFTEDVAKNYIYEIVLAL